VSGDGELARIAARLAVLPLQTATGPGWKATEEMATRARAEAEGACGLVSEVEDEAGYTRYRWLYIVGLQRIPTRADGRRGGAAARRRVAGTRRSADGGWREQLGGQTEERCEDEVGSVEGSLEGSCQRVGGRFLLHAGARAAASTWKGRSPTSAADRAGRQEGRKAGRGRQEGAGGCRLAHDAHDAHDARAGVAAVELRGVKSARRVLRLAAALVWVRWAWCRAGGTSSAL
jgi:hypothetical protein